MFCFTVSVRYTKFNHFDAKFPASLWSLSSKFPGSFLKNYAILSKLIFWIGKPHIFWNYTVQGIAWDINFQNGCRRFQDGWHAKQSCRFSHTMMCFLYKKTKYILKVRSLKNIVIWIFKMAAPDSKMADLQNKVVVFLVQRYIFYNREAKYIFKRCTLKNMTWYGLSKWLPPIQRWPTCNTNVVVFVTERCIF